MKAHAPTLLVLLLSVFGFAAIDSYAANLTVTKAEDTNDGVCDADCSLREAVVAAAPSDTIVFSSLFNTPQTITLMIGEMAFNKDLTITGTGSDNVIISGNNLGRIFYITGGATVNISGITLRDGNVGSQDVTDAYGGAIRVSDITLNLHDIYFTNNNAYNPEFGYGYGAAVYGDGSTFVFSNIKAISNNHGTAILAEFSSSLDIQDSQIEQNAGAGLTGVPFLNVRNCVISGNTFGGAGGDQVAISDSSITNNLDVGIIDGDHTSTMTIERCVISGNRSTGPGGGVVSTGVTLIKDSQITNNTSSGFGGGIANSGDLYVVNCYVTGNTANATTFNDDGGGGITNFIGRLFVINSTISGNRAFGTPGVGGGIYDLSNGANPNGRIYLVNSTVANNTSTGGGGGVRIDFIRCWDFFKYYRVRKQFNWYFARRCFGHRYFKRQ